MTIATRVLCCLQREKELNDGINYVSFCLSLLIDVQDMHFARLICVFSFFQYNISPVHDYSPVRRPISSDISVTRQKHQQPSKIIISLHNIIAIPCALAICEIKQTRQPQHIHSLANHSRTITCPLLRTNDQLRLNYCFTGTTHIICSTVGEIK